MVAWIRPLVFSIGLNGYGLRYRSCVASHRAYARRHRLDYRLIAWRPPLVRDASLTAWAKLPLLRRALAEREWVMAIDVDCLVTDQAPAFPAVERDDRSLYMTKGHSGRFNSGVIIARHDLRVLGLLDDMIASSDAPLPKEDDAPWENGVVIHYTRGRSFVSELDRRWNNNIAPTDSDYVRHFTGPMRAHRVVTPLERVAGAVLDRSVKRLIVPDGADPGGRSAALADRIGLR
jgi:hypothetical protein